MENFEFKKYRSDLAKEIRQEPDKTKRREILASAKGSEEYQEAKRLKEQELPAEQENKAEIERLSQYAQEHFEKYRAFDPDTAELLNVIGANREKFESETLPNVSDELVDKVIGFLEGNRDEKIIALLKRTNFDYESLSTSEDDELTKARALLGAILKAQSYDEVVEENKNKEIDFSGFENDPDIPDAKEFIHRIFGTELLQKCLVSKVIYIPDRVIVRINGTDYFLPIDVYTELEKVMPVVKNRKFRAIAYVHFSTDPKFSKKFIPTPIHFYSFHGEEPEKLDYLKHISAEEKMRQYKLGTIAHEVAHHVYDYLMDTDKRKEWKELVDRTGPITDYAKSYAEHALKYDEFFTEAVRLKVTSPDRLKNDFSKINQFLTNHFPEIKI